MSTYTPRFRLNRRNLLKGTGAMAVGLTVLPRFSLREMQGLLRHKQITTTALYSHKKRDSIRRAVAALEEKRSANIPSISKWRDEKSLNG